MSFLLDTNVLSEPLKPRPNPGVLRWLASVDESELFLSVAVLAELRHGVERLVGGARRRQIEAWLDGDLLLRFYGRVLPVDAEVARVWGCLVARAGLRGHTLEAMDGLMAATATVHALTLVTRNTSDFTGVVAALVNPFD